MGSDENVLRKLKPGYADFENFPRARNAHKNENKAFTGGK